MTAWSVRSASGLTCERKLCAYAMKKRCSGVNPSIEPGRPLRASTAFRSSGATEPSGVPAGSDFRDCASAVPALDLGNGFTHHFVALTGLLVGGDPLQGGRIGAADADGIACAQRAQAAVHQRMGRSIARRQEANGKGNQQ